MTETCLEAAERLHRYLVGAHWRTDGLYGPDPGIRLNYRVGRFVKSYLRALPWNDDLYYLQGQGYWVLANWELWGRTHRTAYREYALTCCESILRSQGSDGSWIYPNREWKGRVATVEGIWASLALLETHRRSGDDRCLEAALRWHRYLLETTGFQRFGEELAINYFAHTKRGPVPNNSADALRFFSALAVATGRDAYLEPCDGLVRFLANVQKPSGEFPYIAKKQDGERERPHFQCFQYNAFMCLGLMSYLESTGDPSIRPVIEKVLDFLPGGLSSEGSVSYECFVPYRHVTYHAAVVAAAFVRARRLGFSDREQLAQRAFRYVLKQQRVDGSFVYSRGDYRILSDYRSYPRYLAMILYHLLHPGLGNSLPSAPLDSVSR